MTSPSTGGSPSTPATATNGSGTGSSTASSAGTPSPTPSGPVTLTGGGGVWLILALIAVFAGVGGIVVYARTKLGKRTVNSGPIGPSVVRSWLALGLTVGMLVLAGAAFIVDDTAVRSTLIGSVTASVGAVIAYYFATKSNENAIAALTNPQPATATADIPDLSQKTVAQALTLLNSLGLRLAVDPISTGSIAEGNISGQSPAAGGQTAVASIITVTLT